MIGIYKAATIATTRRLLILDRVRACIPRPCIDRSSLVKPVSSGFSCKCKINILSEVMKRFDISTWKSARRASGRPIQFKFPLQGCLDPASLDHLPTILSPPPEAATLDQGGLEKIGSVLINTFYTLTLIFTFPGLALPTSLRPKPLPDSTVSTERTASAVHPML